MLVLRFRPFALALVLLGLSAVLGPVAFNRLQDSPNNGHDAALPVASAGAL